VAYLATEEKAKKNQNDCDECDQDGNQKCRFIHQQHTSALHQPCSASCCSLHEHSNPSLRRFSSGQYIRQYDQRKHYTDQNDQHFEQIAPDYAVITLQHTLSSSG